MDMPISLDKEELASLLHKLVDKNQISDGIIYFQATRGVSPRDHLYEREDEPVFTGFTKKLSAENPLQKTGVAVWLTDDIRWLRCDIKTINLLGNVFAKREAADHSCQEAILHRDGIITEGSASNLFLVSNETLYTHPATNLILNGITRQLVIEIARENGYKVVEEPFPKEVIAQADEAFITSTTMEITPVTSVSGQIEATLPVGSVTRALQEAFAKKK